MIMPTCRKLKTTEDCYLEKSKWCPNHMLQNVEAAWKVTKGLVEGRCVEDKKPVCDFIKARVCWQKFRRLDDETTVFQDVCK